MSYLRVGNIDFAAGLVIFDKDGTLIDFEHAWGGQAIAGVESLVDAVQGDDALRRDLYRSIGYDPQNRRTAGDGPLAIASMANIYTVAAAVLYQHGFSWDHAEARVKKFFAARMTALPLDELILPVADTPALFAALHDAGIQIAIVTTDDRNMTLKTAALLGITDYLDFVACGDDHIPLKPAPDAVLHACVRLGVIPARTMIVGDTVADMIMGTRARVGCRAAVLTGVSARETLAPHADVVLNSIADIRVVAADNVSPNLYK